MLGQRDVYFVADQAMLDPKNAEYLLSNSDVMFVTLPHDKIRGFSRRWYQLQDNALEIFLIYGTSRLFSFNSTQVRHGLVSAHL